MVVMLAVHTIVVQTNAWLRLPINKHVSILATFFGYDMPIRIGTYLPIYLYLMQNLEGK